MDKKYLIEYQDCKKLFIQDAATIPDFIDTNNIIHYRIKQSSSMVFHHLSSLISPVVLSVHEIDVITDKINYVFIEMMDEDTTTALIYYDYIKEILEYYRDMCEEHELFEACNNIDKLMNQFYKIYEQ